MNKSLCVLLAAGGLWVNSSFAETPAEVRVAYSGGSQVLMLAKADGSLDKALNSKVKWVQFASGADALTLPAMRLILLILDPARQRQALSENCRWKLSASLA